mgnify:CR=1 FL=1
MPLAKDFEDQLEKLAIIDVWPWMKRNAALVIGLNMLVLFGADLHNNLLQNMFLPKGGILSVPNSIEQTDAFD